MGTSQKPLNVLLVEDDLEDARTARRILGRHPGVRTVHAESLEAIPRDGHWDAVVVDLSLPECRGVETVCRIHQLLPGTPMVVLTGLDDEETGAAAMRAGAQDYLVKGSPEVHGLVRAVR